MVKALLILACAAGTLHAAPQCPFLEEQHESPVFDRLKKSLQDFQGLCRTTPGSEVSKRIDAIQAKIAAVRSTAATDPAVAGAGSWLGVPITCGNYPRFLSEQRDDFYRRWANGLTVPDDSPYKECLKQDKGQILRCIDGKLDERLRFAGRHCDKVDSETQRKARQQSLGESYDLIAENFKQLVDNMGRECAPAENAQLQKSALKTAATLATLMAGWEPVSTAAGVGIAMGGKILNHAIDHLFRQEDPMALLGKVDMIPDLSCLLLDTMEAGLNCAKTLKVEPAAEPEKPLLSMREPDEASSKASVDEVLRAMQNVEKRAASEKGLGSPAVDLSESPAVGEFIALMNQPAPPLLAQVVSRRGRGPVTLHDYLAQVASDLKFEGNQTWVEGPTERDIANVEAHFAGRAYIPDVVRNLTTRNAAFHEASGALGNDLGQVTATYQEYRQALGGVDPEVKRRTRAAFMAKVNDLSSLKLDTSNSPDLTEKVQHAIRRHWQLTLPPESGLRKLHEWEAGQQLRQSLRDGLVQKASPISADKFVILKDGYGSLVTDHLSQKMASLKNTLEDLKEKRGAVNASIMESLYDNPLKGLVDQCVLLAGTMVFDRDTLSTKGLAAYEKHCGPLLCKDGSGIPLFDERNPAIAFQQHQCKLIYEHANIRKRFHRRFTTSGTLCDTEPPKTLGQRVKDGLRLPKWKLPGLPGNHGP